jgi:hypothetical protein
MIKTYLSMNMQAVSCVQMCVINYITSSVQLKKEKLSDTHNQWKQLKGKLWLVSHLYDVPVKLCDCSATNVTLLLLQIISMIKNSYIYVY